MTDAVETVEPGIMDESLSASTYIVYIQGEAKKSVVSGILADFGNFFFSTRHGYQYY